MLNINASSTSYEKRLELVDSLMTNMGNIAHGDVKESFLLAGDPGVGKTSFVRFLAKFLGVDLVVIEAPHITEEHIINIPFIQFHKDESKKGEAEFDPTTYDIVLSKSNLLAVIQHSKKLPDAEYLQYMYSNAPTDMRTMFEHMGGSEKRIPQDIRDARQKFDVILFLDEYFRQDSVRIRNMLRMILDGKLGKDDLPANAYVVYASNMHDQGVETMPKNAQFRVKQMDTPSKDEWFSWFVSQFEHDNSSVKLNHAVINHFYKELEEEHLNFHDADKSVRTSPRRWAQLLLVINSAFPMKTQDEAKALLTTIKTNFTNYMTGEMSSLGKVVMKSAVDLIKAEAGLEVSTGSTHDETEWRESLRHQIELKKKLGIHRTYVPIISGLPGIGKTTEMMTLAAEEGLRYIYVNCSTLNAEDVLGIALPKKGKDGEIETSFSQPKLYKIIMDDIAKMDAVYKKKLNAADGKSYDKSPWKYLIFFDEINRNSTKVFNGIRKVLLEKSFGHGFELPDTAMIVAAINPEDAGALELTSHVSDVVDVIRAAPEWTKTLDYIDASLQRVSDRLYEPACAQVVQNILVQFNEKFRVKKSTSISHKLMPYYLNMGAAEDVYVSPREYSMLAVHMATALDKKLRRLNMHDLDLAGNPDDANHILEEGRKSLFSSMKETLDSVFYKHELDSPEFMNDLRNWFMMNDDTNFLRDLTSKRADGIMTLDDIIDPYTEDSKKHLADEVEFINYVTNSDVHQIKEDLMGYLLRKFEADKEKFIKHTKHKKKTLENGKLQIVQVADSKDAKKLMDVEITQMEYIIREMMHAVEIHRLAHDAINAVKEACDAALKVIINDDDFMFEAVDVNENVLNFMKKELESTRDK